MKTKNLLPILLLAVSMVSCTTYYQVKTQVFLMDRLVGKFMPLAILHSWPEIGHKILLCSHWIPVGR